jgi:phosphate transport system substrate-binding protein
MRKIFFVALVAVLMIHPSVANAAPAKINGSGSTYVALAMQQWVADAQTSGLSVNYLPTGSPQGLTAFGQGLIDFAGTEAEYSALGNAGGADQRGYQYVPDVAGAVAVMYNVDDQAGRHVDYLHLSRATIARIFIGDIAFWDDPAIVADNKGLVLPHQPITVIYRAGQSGTTALFYDFVAHTVPDQFNAWAARNQLPTQVRIIQLDSAPNFAPKTLALNGSDQIAQYTASAQGKWAIAYDEFGYAKTYGAEAAWVQNQSGAWVLPYAENISAALESATLRPDLSQELSGVYASGNPLAYPISAYSYMVTQCAPSAQRATCKGPYSNGGVAETLSKWMRYIACDGQVNMARIGYSPLPPNLSQEIANSIARMTGTGAEQLTQANCSNPRFSGSLGEGSGSPTDPLANVQTLDPGASGGGGGGGGGGAATTGGAADNSGAAGATGTDSTASDAGAAGRAGNVRAVGGGSGDWRTAAPVAFAGQPPPPNSLPVILLLGLIVVPPILLSRRKKES